MLALLASLALADTITLDTGAVVEGDLARYELGGDCQVSVTEGPLTGVILIAPCHRVLAFVRSPHAAPQVLAAIEPVAPVVEVEVDTVRGDAVQVGERTVDELPTFLAAEEPREVDSLDDAASGDPPADDPPADDAPSADRDADSRGDAGDATVQPRAAPLMPPVTTRPLSF